VSEATDKAIMATMKFNEEDVEASGFQGWTLEAWLLLLST
jgi:hypothetical protein